MKIKAKDIKPGMVIGIDRGDDFGDICLVLTTSGWSEVSYTHLDLQHSCGGALVGTIGGEETVKVFEGEKRKPIMKHIKNEVFRGIHDLETLIDMIRLIEAMEETK